MGPNKGWDLMVGISNTTITNGMYPPEEGDQGTKRYFPDIEVFVPDLTPNAMGVPDKPENVRKVEPEVTDPYEKKTAKSTVFMMHTIKCHYMGQPNYLVPCVHAGEQVWVLSNHGEENSYYWLPMSHNDEGIRLHEHLRWFAMNQSKSVDPKTKRWAFVDDDNTYFVDINTNKGKKLIQIHTAKNDGEPYGYDIRIKPEESRLEIKDTVGNELSLDSANTIWFMRNINDSFLQLNKENITLSCLGTMNLTAGKIINESSGWIIDALGRSLEVAGAKGVINRKTGTEVITVVGGRTITTPTTSHNGDYKINGHEDVSSGANIQPDATIGKWTFMTHGHTGNLGAPTTPPIY